MNSSIEHIQLVNKISEYCEDHVLTIFKHEYDYMVFSSWVLIIGKNKHRMKFGWDGKESYLSVETSEFQNSNSVAIWESVFPGVSGTQKKEEEIFSFIKETLGKQYVI